MVNEIATRRRFLRFAGSTLAAGAALIALPATVVAASDAPGTRRPTSPARLLNVTYTCYADTYQCGCGCSSGSVPYYCVASGCAAYCTGCQSVSSKGCSYTVVQGGC
jgi:hypothetical protein